MIRKYYLLVLLALMSAGCTRTPGYNYNEGLIYGTIYHIVYESRDGKDLHDEIKKNLGEYNRIFSTFDTVSVISKINNNKPVKINSTFLACFNKSMEISKRTGGAFDITTGPLVNAWGFGPEKRKEMTPAKIDSLLKITGYEKIRLQEGKVINRPGHHPGPGAPDSRLRRLSPGRIPGREGM